MKSLASIGAVALAIALAGASGSLGAPPAPPNPSRFVAHVDNPWFPLRVGTTYIYRGVKDGQSSRDVLTVTAKTRVIEGVRCTVVHDRLYLGKRRGRLEERTQDWYAQDRVGNVWYFGEATAELNPNGSIKTTEGSWQSGVHGARAGIFMPANPHLGQSGLQELYKGHAEDHFRVLSLSGHVHTPAVSSRHALLTREWTPLEPGVVDHKLYVKGIGTVLEQTVRGGDERNALIKVERRRTPSAPAPS